MTLVPTSLPAPEIEGQWKLAQRLCNTDFVPQAFKGKPENILAAILTGHEHGIGPMQALQSINVIQGKPTLSPELMRALVARAGHRVDTLAYTDVLVTLKGTRSDTGAVAEVTWTMDDAKRANLTGKGAWKTYPRAMLLARATAELCRLLYPDIIAGLSYTEEELGGEPAVVPVASTTTAEAPPLPNEIKVDALPPAPGPSMEQGSGSTAASPEPPVPGPSPSSDADGEPAEAEIVEETEREGTASSVLEDLDGGAVSPGQATVISPPPGASSSTSDVGRVEGAEANSDSGLRDPSTPDDNPQAVKTAASDNAQVVTPDDTTWSPSKWREEGKKRGVSQRGLIVKAREIAEDNGLDIKVTKLADLINPEISPALRVWLLLQEESN